MEFLKESRRGTTFAPAADTPIPTTLGIIEGDVLSYLELYGPTSLYRLIQAHDWPATRLIMAVGALIRQGLVRGSEQQLEAV